MLKQQSKLKQLLTSGWNILSSFGKRATNAIALPPALPIDTQISTDEADQADEQVSMIPLSRRDPCRTLAKAALRAKRPFGQAWSGPPQDSFRIG